MVLFSFAFPHISIVVSKLFPIMPIIWKDSVPSSILFLFCFYSCAFGSFC